jgi:hypothetical protein
MYHYARAPSRSSAQDAAGAQARSTRSPNRGDADFKPFEAGAAPPRIDADRAAGRQRGALADASGDLDGAAKAYESAIADRRRLSYTEPPYWYYPVRSRSARCACARAGSTTPRRRSASRSRRTQQRGAHRRTVESRKAAATPRPSKRARGVQRAWFGRRKGPTSQAVTTAFEIAAGRLPPACLRSTGSSRNGRKCATLPWV